MFEHLVPSWWHYLVRIRRQSPAEEACHWVLSLRNQKLDAIPSSLSLLSAFGLRCELPAARACCQASLSWWWQTRSSGTVSPNASFYKLPQSRYFSTPIENEVIYPVCHLYPGKLWEIAFPWLWASISVTVKQITNAPTQHDGGGLGRSAMHLVHRKYWKLYPGQLSFPLSVSCSNTLFFAVVGQVLGLGPGAKHMSSGWAAPLIPDCIIFISGFYKWWPDDSYIFFVRIQKKTSGIHSVYNKLYPKQLWAPRGPLLYWVEFKG